MMAFRKGIICAWFVFACLFGPAQAAEPKAGAAAPQKSAPAAEQKPEPAPMQKGSGTVTYVPIATETTKLKNGSTVIRTRMKGVIVADDPKTPFHLAGQSCGGTTVLSAKGFPPHSSGYCSTIDKDGDAWWIWWRAEGRGSIWEFIDGTGKYADIDGKGKTATLVRLSDGRQTLRWEGSWRLR